ncbi:MAG TPA: hypothetical protein VGQ51_05425 [Puia sp.]|jgi:hypothetical protein|nr:hypothetical protein [Puia sp.]
MKKILLIGAIACFMACRHRSGVIPNITSLPAFTMLLIDSTTHLASAAIPSGAPLIFMYFRPDCRHCQADTRLLIKNMDSLKSTHIYLLTPMPFKELKGFYDSFDLGRFKNITVAEDEGYSFYKSFQPAAVPYMAIYDSHKRLVNTYLGDRQIQMNNIFKAIYQ